MLVLITVGSYVYAEIFVSLVGVVEGYFNFVAGGVFAVFDKYAKGEVCGVFDFIFAIPVVNPGNNVNVAFIDFEFSSGSPEKLFPFCSVVRHYPGDFVEGCQVGKIDAYFCIINEGTDANGVGG